MVVIPCAIQSLKTYSAGVPCSLPPMCPCMSMKPGNKYMPSQFNSFPPGNSLGRFAVSMETPGEPTIWICLILFLSTTISTGPTGGAPVPSTRMTPRIISWFHGPSPSTRSGAFFTCAKSSRGKWNARKRRTLLISDNFVSLWLLRFYSILQLMFPSFSSFSAIPSR